MRKLRQHDPSATMASVLASLCEEVCEHEEAKCEEYEEMKSKKKKGTLTMK